MKIMKKIVLTLFLVFSFFVSAQEAKSVFAPIGAKWYYGIQPSQFAPDQFYRTIESIKDTLIQDKKCSVVEIKDFYTINSEGSTLGYSYFFSEQQKVFTFNKNTEVFELLYDFSANKGDSWQVPCKGCNGDNGVDFITVTVLKIDSVEISGKKLKRIFYTTDGLYSFGTNDKTITEYIGGDGYLFLFGYAFDDMYIPTLRCYSDIFLNYAVSEKKCDFITTPLNVHKVSTLPEISIIDNKIYFLNSDFIGSEVGMYDLNGKNIFNTILNPTNCIEIGNIEKGIYLIQMRNATGSKTIKMIKV